MLKSVKSSGIKGFEMGCESGAGPVHWGGVAKLYRKNGNVVAAFSVSFVLRNNSSFKNDMCI